MRSFFSQLGPTANWTPSEVQNTFIYKRSSLWRQSQKILKAVDQFPTDPLFESAKNNNESFLVCILTENLHCYHEEDENNKTRLLDFLDEYKSPYIWTCGRPMHLPRRNTLSERILDENYFEIMDLEFSSNKRSKKIHVKALYNDVIMMVIPEPGENVVVMAHSEYHYTCKNTKGKMIVKAKPLYKKMFSSKTKAAKNKLGQGDLKPGSSGQSQSSSRSQPSGKSNSSSRSQPSGRSKFNQSESSIDRSQKRPKPDKTRPEQTNDDISGNSQIKRGRKRKREPEDYNTVRFCDNFITVVTDIRTQKFPIETVSKDNISLRHKKWIGGTEEIRRDQWEQIQINADFDLFERVRNDDAMSLRFFRFKEIFPQESIQCCMREWDSKCKGPFPDNLMYIMYDSSKVIPYLGSFYNLYLLNLFKLY